MDIALLNERITVERNEARMDSNGNHVNGWTEYFSCAASAAATSYQQREQEKAGTIVGENGLVFTVRYCSELSCLDSTHFRVIFHGKAFNITSVDMMDFTRESIRISCEQERRQDDEQ